jgi:PAS domain S-box-containing protein
MKNTTSLRDGEKFTVQAMDTSLPDRPVQTVMGTGFFVVDNNWTVIYWNKVAETITKKESKDVVGFVLWQVSGISIPEELRSLYNDTHQPAISPQQPTVAHFARMGNWREVVSYKTNDTLSVSFRTALPAAPEPNAQERLAFLNDVYRFITEVSADCLWERDISSREFFWLDGGHKRVLGYPIVDAVVPQQFWEDCLHPDDRMRVLAGMENAVASGECTIWEDEYRFKKLDNTYCYFQDRAYIIGDKTHGPLRMIGAAHDITARRQAEMRLIESERILGQERLLKQKEVTEAVLAAQEREKAEIGRELHDNLNQILGAAKMYIELAKTNEESRSYCLNKSAALLTLVIQDVRNLSKTLTVPDRRLMKISESITILLDNVREVHPVAIVYNEHGIEEDRLTDKLCHDILRIVQEQLNNIMKHAEATSAAINLRQENSDLVLQIIDNGMGCDLELETDGIGLANIKMRVDSHNGDITLDSQPGEGFALTIKFPLRPGH